MRDSATAISPRHFPGAPVMARGLMFGIIAMIVAESVGVHALVYTRSRIASLVLLVVNIWTVWWLWREGSAESRTSVTADAIEVRHGRSTRADIPLASVREVRVPTWQQIPQSGTSGYSALSAGDDPNVLVTCDPPAQLQLMMGITRPVRVLGLRLESPAEFVAAVERARG